ncbi:alpha/beta-hydrolase [Zopfia rhizophila CBS 207.26]|uniref:Carboxylic ester hydrolase n=1 Tax=Zopfia rhizophila CBS 207.26 TaxID=1314779 RepID=A0A6A6E837_9PEZI|nr:alpha/beta-hydrolase [Zopfia rhizophila CBS 207.26]
MILPFSGLLATIAYASPIIAQNSPVVDLGYTKYLGTNNSTLSLNTYFGIKFAQAPTGSLRWKAPVPVSESQNSSNTSIINATTPGASCIQGFPFWITPSLPVRPPGSEDCLLLNVIQPSHLISNTSARLPVVVYRLGAYGFLWSDEISEDGASNAALLDQRLALEWVQRHIEAFGGDPEKVTIWGGSAGGGSVTDQMVMYGGVEKPPFNAAIAEFPWWQQFLRKEQLQRQYGHLLDAANCTDLGCLRELDEERLAVATQATYTSGYADGLYGYGNYYYGPYVDGKIIQDLPSREFKKGRFTKVPMLVDRDMYEGASFTNTSITTTEEEIMDLKVQFPYADQAFTEKLWELYPASGFNSTFWRRSAWFGDATIHCPTYYIASSLTPSNLKTYKLIFNAGTQVHAATGPFLSEFPSELGHSPAENATIGLFMKDWYASFIVSGDPNVNPWSGVKKPYWPVYGNEGDVMMVNYTDIGGVNDGAFDRGERCEFWWENGDVAQN